MRKESKTRTAKKCRQSLWAATCFSINRRVSVSFNLHVYDIVIHCNDIGIYSASRSIMLNQPSPNNFTCDCSSQ